LQSFEAELRRIQDALANPNEPDQIAGLEASLPPYWTVDTPERKYEVSTERLRSLLEDARNDSAHRAQRIGQAQEWVGELVAEVKGYAAGGERRPDARPKLERILAAREFATVYRQSAWERFKQRAWAWIWRMLTTLARRVGGHPIAARALFWLLLLGAVAAVALLLFRAWIRRAHFDELKAPAAPDVAQAWQEWIRAARLAADRGNFRDAVHSIYWAGIVHLESARIIPCERTRTPRERLRQLPSPQTGIGEATKRRDALQALTARLERTWYAGLPATQQDFVESLRLVEELGCQWQ